MKNPQNLALLATANIKPENPGLDASYDIRPGNAVGLL